MKTYAGVEIIESESVPVRHPRWGYEKLAVLKGATLYLLADGTTLVVCDDCGYNGLTGKEPYIKPEGDYKPILKQADSILSHRNGTHMLAKPRGPMYTEDQIKAVIKIWLKWKATGIKSWGQSACDELTRLGFKTYRGGEWTPSVLGSLARVYTKRQNFRNIKAAPMSEADREVVKAVAKENKDVPKLNFVGRGGGDVDETPIRQLKVDLNEKFSKGHSVPDVLPAMPAPTEYKGDFEFIANLDDGTPLFRYKGVLMVGKPVKGVEI